VVARATWTATELLSFSFYGCRFIPEIGVDLGDDNLRGGAVKMAVVLGHAHRAVAGECSRSSVLVGPKAPASHNDPSGEGMTLNVPGVVNFNHVEQGETIFIRIGWRPI
jgi:hypothetical protein